MSLMLTTWFYIVPVKKVCIQKPETNEGATSVSDVPSHLGLTFVSGL
jgi:hypothetical protein